MMYSATWNTVTACSKDGIVVICALIQTRIRISCNARSGAEGMSFCPRLLVERIQIATPFGLKLLGNFGRFDPSL